MKNLIFILFFLILVNFVQASEESIKIIYIKGKAEIQNEQNELVELSKDDGIFEGDEIYTGDDSYVVLRLLDNSIIKVEPNSKFLIEELAPVVQGKTFGTTEAVLKAGRAFFEIINTDKQEVLNIKTNDISLGVRGTNFFVDSDQQETWVGVQEGEVEVIDPLDKSKREVVLPNEGMKVEKGRRFTKPKNYQWLKNINYRNDDFKNLRSGFKNIKQQRRSEFRKKREDWKFNSKRYEKRRKKWQERKAIFREKNKNIFANLKQRKQGLKKRQLEGRKKRSFNLKNRIRKRPNQNRGGAFKKRQLNQRKKNVQRGQPRKQIKRRMPPRRNQRRQRRMNRR